MPIATTDISYRLSGGASNSDPNASLGGVKSTTSITDNVSNNLWPSVTGDQANAGFTTYRCIYVHNGHATLTWLAPVVWITQLTLSSDDEVDIGLGSSAVNGTEQTVVSETTIPSTVVFSRPTSKLTGLTINDIPAGQHKAIWIRRTVTAGAAAFTNNSYALRTEGDTAA